MALVERVKGTQDYYPEEWAQQVILRDLMISQGEKYGYKEYEGPLIEYLKLYLGKSSEEIVTKQTFRIQDRDGKALLLRPELTPTLARMIAARERQITLPVRWQSFGQFFRYEKPQRGRGRSFYQWNVDLLGSESSVADAEIIQIACSLFESLDIDPTQVQIRINDRAELESDLTGTLGIKNCQLRGVVKIIDRLEKISKDLAVSQLIELGIGTVQASEVIGYINSPVEKLPPRLATIIEQMQIANQEAYIQVDRRIVRGFDYYTGPVFEAWGLGDLQRSIFGGGRYDNLIHQIGGKTRVPGVGMAVGDMALIELLRSIDKMPQQVSENPEVVITVFSNDERLESARLANQLRRRGLNVLMCLDPSQRLDRQLKYADRVGARFVFILGPDEVSNSTIIVKDLLQRTQKIYANSDLDIISAAILDHQSKQ